MWKLLEKHLEEIRDGRGTKPEQSQREFLEAVLYLVRTGDPWRDLPVCQPNAFVRRFAMQKAVAHVSNYRLNLFA